jgi:hypothetical protein
MLITLALIVPIGLVVYVVVYWCERNDARERADEFLLGTRKPIPKDIDKCIKKLRTANSRLLDRNETDRRRIERLRDISDYARTSYP